ncbi:helix-turn-helix domain-containing protein [Pseudonocardia sp. NPDC049154]|uniref:MmyB family transcriptional regulator n=1 Tax=Pseudonocardia sp. NPDC049154 TaxID=3155501 RepID=UPI00340F5B43
MHRTELADFLRRARERLSPEEVGLPRGVRRRTPGLRREEVAQLAGVSGDYVMRLEQRRSAQPSTQLLAALARALRLTKDERDHLFLLAGHRPPAGPRGGGHVEPGVLHLLDTLVDTPAQVVDEIGTLLAQNRMAETLFGEVCTVSGDRRNVVLRWFTDPAVRAPHPPEERERLSRVHVADLRAALARRRQGGRDREGEALVARLRRDSPEFAALWEEHEVAVRRESRMRVHHPAVGLLELDSVVLRTTAEDQHLLLFTPAPGTGTAGRLGLLRVVGPEQFTPSARR